jgi:hypothetical protein
MEPASFAACFVDSETGEPVLTVRTREHLLRAAEMLADQIGEDIRMLEARLQRDPQADVWESLSWLHQYLPTAYAASYDYGFLRDFQTTVLTVIYQLGGSWTGLASVMEELAMNAILESADTHLALLKDEGEDVGDIDFTGLWELAFWDLDFEVLFQPELDGIQNTDIGLQTGMANLDRSDWFRMFHWVDVPPHPLTWRRAGPDESPSR